MRNLYALVCCFLSVCALGAQLPDNVYFRAMQDEMQRTKKELRVKGSAKPFFTAYRLQRMTRQHFGASMGEAYPGRSEAVVSPLSVTVYIYAGDARHNSSGFVDDYYTHAALSGSAADSYGALRQVLWRLTDVEYVKASNVADKKEAYKRRKNMPDDLPDFSFAPRTGFAEDIPPFERQDGAVYTALAAELSAAGKTLPFLEKYDVWIHLGQTEEYFLDSEGDFSQTVHPDNWVRYEAKLRNRDGYVQTLRMERPLPVRRQDDEAYLRAGAEEFLEKVRQSRQAVKAEPYIGPVLLTPRAAGEFFNQLFVKNVRYGKPLLSAISETDVTAGKFKDKTGMRVMSPLFDVFDRPLAREYAGMPLAGFMPVDQEGVAAEELQLVENGKLKALPSSRSLMSGQKQSNGHARMARGYPRATLTNVFFEPKKPLSAREMEEKLLERCRELDLEYCYIFDSFPRGGNGEAVLAERIYTKDGRREPVYGLSLDGLGARSLRDIRAAGSDLKAVTVANGQSSAAVSVVTPSVLVDEVELSPTQRKPDRKPFVSLPQ